MSAELLKHCLSYGFYKKNKDAISEDFFDTDLKKLYTCVGEHFSTHEADLTENELMTLYRSRYPAETTAKYRAVETIIDNISEIESSSDVAETIIQNQRLQVDAAKVAQIAFDIADGKHREIEDLSGAVTTLQRQFIGQSDYDYEPLTDDLEELMEMGNVPCQWKFHLEPFRERAEGVGPGTLSLIAARVNCFPKETELLTSGGWKPVLDVTTSDMVAQVDPTSHTWDFCNPLEVVRQTVDEDLLHVTSSSRGVDYMTTLDHDLAFEHIKTGELFKVPAKDANFSSLHRHVVAKPKSGGVVNTLTWLERLRIAYQADGSPPHNPNNTGKRVGTKSIRFSFSKERKKERLRWILAQLPYEWVEFDEAAKVNYTTFYVKIPLDQLENFPKTLSWVTLGDKSSNWAQEFIEEVSYWDAHSPSPERVVYCSRDKSNVDTLQAVSSLAGYRSTYKFIGRYKEHHSDSHRLSMHLKYYYVDARTLDRTAKRYVGDVGCVTMPTGYVLARYNNQVFVSGNCGKTLFITSLVFQPGGWASQGAKVLLLGNEEFAARTKLRGVSSYTGIDVRTVERGSDQAKELQQMYNEIAGNIKVVDVVGMDFSKLEEMIEVHTPDIVIIDQLDKVKVQGKFNGKHEEYGAIYTKAREVAKKHKCAVVGVTQVSAEAEGKLYYSYDLLAGSKTDKAAECDLIITIGKDGYGKTQGEDNGFRVANFCKNKLTGREGHEAFTIIPELSRIAL